MNQALAWATSQPGNWHDSGSLGPDVLKRICEAASSYDGCVSAETGCGLSTVVLSHASVHHTCFTLGEGNSLAKVRAEPLLHAASVEFIVGPSQKTLPSHQFVRPLHIALIDGPHGWPFPELDYYHLYPNIVPGGTLIVDDVHIPTIARMCEVLHEDTMWEHVEDVLTTSFFRRTSAPLLDPIGDDWWKQNYNKRHFVNPESLAPYLGEGWWKI